MIEHAVCAPLSHAPTLSFTLPSPLAAMSSKQDKATTERHAKTLREMLKNPENKVCADCKRNGASTSYRSPLSNELTARVQTLDGLRGTCTFIFAIEFYLRLTPVFQRRVPLYPLLRYPSVDGYTHQQGQVRRSGCLDTRADGGSSAPFSAYFE